MLDRPVLATAHAPAPVADGMAFDLAPALRAYGLALIVFGGLFYTIHLPIYPQRVTPILIALVGAAVLLLLRVRRSQGAARAACWGTLVAAVLGAYTGMGLRSLVWGCVPVVILIGNFLLGTTAALVLTGTGVAATLVLIGLHLSGHPFAAPAMTSIGTPLAALCILVFAAAIGMAIARAFRVQLARAEDLRTSLDAVLDSTVDLVWSVDARDHALLEFNAATRDFAARALGVSLARGMTPRDVFPSSLAADRWDDLYRRALTEGGCVVEESVVGDARVHRIALSVVRRDDEVRGVSVFATDITHRIRVEHDLLGAKGKLKGILDAIPDILFEVGADGTIHDFHSGQRELLVADPENFIGRKFAEFLPEDAAGTVFDALRDAAAEGRSTGRSYSLALPAGNRRFELSVACKPARAQGDPIFIVLARDITLRTVAEEQVRTLSRAVEQSAESIVITDPHARIEYVNDACVRLSGYSREELIGCNPKLLQSGQTPPATYESLWRALRGGESWVGEFINRRKNGEQYIERASISPVREPDGRVAHYVAAKTDVTEDRSVAARLQAAKEAAEAANVAKTTFLATMSHEIRTPLNGILGMAEMLTLSGVGEEDRVEYAKVILESSESLMRMLNDLLDIAKVEAGKLELESTVFEPRELVTRAAAHIDAAARSKGLAIESEWSGPAGRRYRGDRGRLRQMLLNLMQNAVKFTDCGGIRIEGREASVDDGSAVIEFAVTDTGIGIGEKDLATIFDSFTQVVSANTRTHGGTGLGLSIVRNFARIMGGDVAVRSTLGSGSRFSFTVRLPIAVASESAVAGEPA